ncbi:N-acetylmuramoyl-L-alanine amidase [Lysinibacillus tabacifolii]|uniref:N-acetylmuramoyl-L-alanine amidase n=1 Tax=Lysinibacillus tabacifolii TaxID=1173107 RepID=A0ABY2T157_9BACI|nr:N-acetylmuramoyl-L-alanine amidase [Lysinibacillus tabacifolii]TKI49743.1 N-acetylmuramoyl-L-alanine amidase [Lysinibacillus tabacifolii]
MSIKEIEIHPGHWINPGSGAVGILNEVIEARKIAKRVFGILKASNVPCTYYEDNTSTNQRQNINYLVNQHNKDRNSLIVSIHLNSGGDSSKAIGTEVLYYDQQALAARISKAISDATGGELPNRGAKQRKDLGVLASTYEPAILIEVCFVNSVVDAVVYRRDFGKICYAIATELAKHLGKTLKLTTQPKTERKREETQMTNSLTSTAKEDLRGLLKVTYQKGILKVDHSDRVGSMTDGEALGLLISVVKRTL